MKVLCYADLQATDGHENCFTNPSKSLQQWRVETFYAKLKQIYDEYDCQGLWDLGDTTDDRSSVPVPVIDTVIAGLEKFPESNLNFKLIGNHEQFLRDTTIHVGRLFNPFFKVVPGFERIHIPEVGVDLLLCSYPAQDGDVERWLGRTKGANRAILLGHFKLRGCQMAGGTAVDGVDASVLTHIKLGLLGHIHKPQTMGKMHYVGSPFQQNFGEACEDKRVGVVDLKTLTVEWVPMDGFPTYSTVSLDEFDSRCTETTEDRFKVVLRSVEESEKFYAHPLGKRAVDVLYEFQNMSGSPEDQVQTVYKSTQDILKRYVQLNPPSGRSIPLSDEEMIQFGEQILSAED